MPQTTLASAFLPPAVLGAALYALLAGPPAVHENLRNALAKLPFVVTTRTIQTGVQVLFGIYVVRALSTVLDRWSFRNWEIFYSGAPWKWDEEIAVVTGGSGDIATAINKKFIARGMKVAILDVNPPKDPAMLNSKNVVYFQCDLTDPASVKETAAKIRKQVGIPTVLVNNAGIAIGMPILQIADRQLERIFKVNLLSHWYTVREFLPDMIKQRKGHIVSVASMASYTGVAGIADYAATKAGALAFHESLTQEIRHLYKAPYIRTTVAHPFWTKTAMTAVIEDGIKKTDTLVTPEYVGGVIADQVFAKIGGHLVIPDYNPKMRLAPMLRGWPSWINSVALDGTKQSVLTTMNTAEGMAEAKARYM